MGSEVVERRLAAIVIADVVGYTKLMERDELGAHTALRDVREQVIAPFVAANGGHVVKKAGDGMLVVFASATAALRCSIDIQRTMHRRNESAPDGDRIEFRFGVNLGDIIIDGDDIAGDGVNVASRLESIAKPGGICISASVREQVHGGLDAGFVDIGEQHVKNIDRPIRTYRVSLAEIPNRRLPAVRVARRRPRYVVAGILGVVIATGGLASLHRGDGATKGVPERPFMSVAILPFAARHESEQPAADQMTQAVTTALARNIRPVRVASHGLVTNYSGSGARDPRQAGAVMNVRYLVEGDFDRSSEGSVLDVRLVDAATGVQLWSDRQALPAAAPESDPSVATRLSDAVGGALGRIEARRIARLPGQAANAMQLVLRANVEWHQDPSLKGTLAARTLYEEALRLDPNTAYALIGLGYTLQMQLVDDPTADQERLVHAMNEVSNRAIRADPDDPIVWLLRGSALALQMRRAEALEANAVALDLDPYLASALQDQAALLISMGRPSEALALLERASVSGSGAESGQTTYLYACRAHLASGSYRDAVRACERAAALGLDWWFLHMLSSAAYAQSGDSPNAALAKSRLLQQRPDMTIAKFKAMKRSDDAVYAEQTETHLIGGLRLAGLPEY